MGTMQAVLAQKIEWSRTTGSKDHWIDGTKELPGGKLLIGGTFRDSVWYGDRTSTTTIRDNSSEFIRYLIKLDGKGNVLDSHTLRSPGFVRSNTFHWDSLGNAYMAGAFNDSVNLSFDDKNPHYVHAKRYQSFYVVKYDSLLNIKWAGILSDTAQKYLYPRFQIDPAGNCYMTGKATATLDADLTDSVQYVPSSTSTDYFMAAYSPDGILRWSQIMTFARLGNIHNHKIKDSTFYLIGYYDRTVDFDLGPGTNALTSTGSDDAFVATYKIKDGSFLNIVTLQGVNDDRIYAIEIDENGAVYIAGYSQKETQFDPKGKGFKRKTKSGGLNDGFICKYDKGLRLKWARFFYGDNRYSHCSGDHLILNDDHLYLSGGFQESIIFERDSLITQRMEPPNAEGSFVYQVDTRGNTGWFHTYYANNKNRQTEAELSFVAHDNVYITGYARDSVNGNNGDLKYRFDHERKPFSSFNFLIKTETATGIVSYISDSICLGQTYTYPDQSIKAGKQKLSFGYTARDGRDSIIHVDIKEHQVNTSFTVSKDSLWAKEAGVKYLWIDCNTQKPLSPADTQRFYLAPKAGDYALVVDDGMCVDTSICRTACNNSLKLDLDTLPEVAVSCSVPQPKVPTATSSCWGSVSATTRTKFPITTQGFHTVIWNYKDKEGDTLSQTQSFIIKDIGKPIPVAKELRTVTSKCAVSFLNVPKALDNCKGKISATTNQSFPISAYDTTVVVWKYDDGHGNEITQQQLVVIDSFIGGYKLDTGISITALDSGFTYKWLRCDNSFKVIQKANQRKFSPGANGSFAVVVSDGTCTDTLACVQFKRIATSLSEVSKITVYPNPAQQFVNLTTNTSYQLDILAIDGRVLEHNRFITRGTTTLDLSLFERHHVLILHLKNEDSNHFHKLIKR